MPSVGSVAKVSLVNVYVTILAIPMKAVVPSVLATPNVLPIVLVYARNAPILVPEPVVLKLFAPLTITYQYALAPTVTPAMPLSSAHQLWCRKFPWKNTPIPVIPHLVARIPFAVYKASRQCVNVCLDSLETPMARSVVPSVRLARIVPRTRPVSTISVSILALVSVVMELSARPSITIPSVHAPAKWLAIHLWSATKLPNNWNLWIPAILHRAVQMVCVVCAMALPPACIPSVW